MAVKCHLLLSVIELMFTPLIGASSAIRVSIVKHDLSMKWKDENRKKVRLRLSAVDFVLQCPPVGGRAKNQHYFDHGR